MLKRTALKPIGGKCKPTGGKCKPIGGKCKPTGKVQAHRRKVQAHQEHFKHSYSDFVRNAPTLREAIRNDSYDNEYKSLQGEQRLLDTSCANRSRDLN
jgi:hypothetical protein